MRRRTLAIFILVASMVVFVALGWRSLRALLWLLRSSKDENARDALSTLLRINGLPIIMMGGLMLIMLMIYWRMFIRRDENEDDS